MLLQGDANACHSPPLAIARTERRRKLAIVRKASLSQKRMDSRQCFRASISEATVATRSAPAILPCSVQLVNPSTENIDRIGEEAYPRLKRFATNTAADSPSLIITVKLYFAARFVATERALKYLQRRDPEWVFLSVKSTTVGHQRGPVSAIMKRDVPSGL